MDHRIDKWIPTDEELVLIEKYSGLGLSIKKIAPLLNIGTSTLERCFTTNDYYIADAVHRGRSKAEAAVTNTAFKMAKSGKQPGMTQFWLKTRAGWKEDAPESARFDKPPKDPTLDD